MNLINETIRHITETAKIPSFSTYEERIHPYIRKFFSTVADVHEIIVPGNNLIFKAPNPASEYTLALTAHLDKINHYGKDYPEELPVKKSNDYIEGAMDDCVGLGIILALAGQNMTWDQKPNLLFLFSEMEESKGLKEHPERLKNNGNGYKQGMGARQISNTCLELNLIPDEIITVDTTPLFKGKSGVALYSKHWELNDLEPSRELIKKTEQAVNRFKYIEPDIYLDNNTNDYLHYGYEFNNTDKRTVVSVALEPAIFPYHQKGERVFVRDIEKVLDILITYIARAGR